MPPNKRFRSALKIRTLTVDGHWLLSLYRDTIIPLLLQKYLGGLGETPNCCEATSSH